MSRHIPTVLIVDDQPDSSARHISAALKKPGFKAQVVHPEDVTQDELADVDLLLVDFDLRDWTQESLPISNVCASGWSLAALLRDKIRAIDRRQTAVVTAILTSQIDDATLPFTYSSRKHIVAGLNGLEWVFEKGEPNLTARIEALTAATQSVRRGMKVSDLMKELGSATLQRSCRDDVIRCRPPLDEELAWEDGLAVLRWMLHRILPYPTFLIDEWQLAAKLGIRAEQVRRLIAGKSQFGKALQATRYEGVLANFAGPRWWRAGVDGLLWKHTNGAPGDMASVRDLSLKALKDVRGDGAIQNLVVCYDENLCPEDDLVEAKHAQRIWPDDWPPYAAQPWARIELVLKSASLKQMTLPFNSSSEL